jgi:hypothetical protein
MINTCSKCTHFSGRYAIDSKIGYCEFHKEKKAPFALCSNFNEVVDLSSFDDEEVHADEP